MRSYQRVAAAWLLLTSTFALAAPTPAEDAWAPRTTPDPLNGELSFLRGVSRVKRQGASLAGVVLPTLNAQGCYPAGTTALQMNLVFQQGGAGAKVVLCPNTSYDLQNTIIYTAPSQELSTLGYPTDSSRALLTVKNAAMSVAVYGVCGACSGISLRSVQIDGSRPLLGPMAGGAAIVEFGGTLVSGQLVQDCKIWEPRGWSCVHLIEGTANTCRNVRVLNNQIGPSGNAPNSAQQFRKRQTGVIQPGLWADGISAACAGSTISGNNVTDATDGGIVLFGAPGTLVTNNTITSQTRVMLGGINMVDLGAWAGNYSGTVVDSNTITTAGSMIKIGIPLGPNNWAGVNNTAYRTQNGTVSNNRFTSTNGGVFGYAIAVSGHDNSNVANNDVSQAAFGGARSAWCIKTALPPSPASPGVWYDPYTSTGVWTGQPDAVATTLAFLICAMPSQYAASGSISAGLPTATATANVIGGAATLSPTALTLSARSPARMGKTPSIPSSPVPPPPPKATAGKGPA